MSKQNRVPCLIRMPPEMYRLITLRKMTSGRSFNAEVVHLLQQLLGQQEQSDFEAAKLLRLTGSPLAPTADER